MVSYEKILFCIKKIAWRHYLIKIITSSLVIGIIVVIAGYYIIASIGKKAIDKEIDHAIKTGDSLISNRAYEEATKEFESILKKVHPNEFPNKFITMQNSLGIAYWMLASRKDSDSNYEKAIHSYQKGLDIATFNKYPEEYALLNNNIGNAYLKLSLFRDSISNLILAIESYDKSLEVYIKRKYPEDYERVQNQKANAFQSLLNTKDISIDADYAYKHYFIGHYFLRAAMVDGNQELANKAVIAFKNALKVYSLSLNVLFSSTSNALGTAYLILWDRQNDILYLENAIAAFNDAFKVYNLQEYPSDYAITHMNLGKAFKILSGIKDKKSNLRKAIKSNKEALKVFSVNQNILKDLKHRIERDQNILDQGQ